MAIESVVVATTANASTAATTMTTSTCATSATESEFMKRCMILLGDDD